MPGDVLIWLDLEMTGLHPERDSILEIATVVTSADLEILAQGPCLPVFQPESVLEGMDSWNTEHHARSGLTGRVRTSGVPLAQAQEETLLFLREWTPAGASPLCGNSICQDRRFLARHMPDLESFFHYRNIDVSSIKELVRRWYPHLAAPSKKEAHRALEDIGESIAELQYYRDRVFAKPVAEGP